MNINDEISICFKQMNNAIMEHCKNNYQNPKYIILPIPHRQAIKILIAKELNIDVWDATEPTDFFRIPIIKREDVILIEEELK